MPNAELLSIGAELLLGETVDTNAAFLGSEMADIGLPLGGARMLPDDRELLRGAFAGARASSATASKAIADPAETTDRTDSTARHRDTETRRIHRGGSL